VVDLVKVADDLARDLLPALVREHGIVLLQLGSGTHVRLEDIAALGILSGAGVLALEVALELEEEGVVDGLALGPAAGDTEGACVGEAEGGRLGGVLGEAVGAWDNTHVEGSSGPNPIDHVPASSSSILNTSS